ncbi:MAG: HPr(Ser) kinase/phosphatase [Parachlamydiales bacterium]
MYTVRKLIQECQGPLALKLVAGEGGLDRPILVPEIMRPGLALTGYLEGHAEQRVVVLGELERGYLERLDRALRAERLRGILTESTPCLLLSRDLTPLPELLSCCVEAAVPLVTSPLPTPKLLQEVGQALDTAFAPTTTRHGTLVEVFGVGILIEGEPGVGKSEAALGLLARGHRLISDDVVRLFREEDFVRGKGEALTRHHMEIRGIGLIDVGQLYGAVCVRECKRVDLVARIEPWDESAHYERIGLDEAQCVILDIPLPFLRVPVKPGRDVVLLLETIALNHRLKAMGRCPARAFSERLTTAIEQGARCTN